MPRKKPGDGLLGWLGRQVGHVRKAVRTDVQPKKKVVRRQKVVREAALPGRPDVTLRRTVIDEVIVRDPKLARKVTR
jgi:hypothetical protein